MPVIATGWLMEWKMIWSEVVDMLMSRYAFVDEGMW
jgi:hypothetical protein